MHADGKLTLVSVSKWNSGKVNYHLLSENTLAPDCRGGTPILLFHAIKTVSIWSETRNGTSENKAH